MQWPSLTLCMFEKEMHVYTSDAVHDAFGTRVVWKTIQVEWLLLERTPPTIPCFVLGKVGYFAHNMLGKG